MDDTTGLKSPCRLVTSDGVEHLNEHGWVKLKRFVDPDVLARMLDLARTKMGEDADSNPLNAGMAPAADGTAAVQPADVCWNGSPCPNFDTTEMAPWMALNDERFPLIG